MKPENMIGRQTYNVGFFAVPAKQRVSIDGALGDWDLSGQISCFADSNLKELFSVRAAAMWDTDNLYLAFVWRDPYPMYSSIDPLRDKTRGWMSDSVQLRVLASDRPSWITLWPFEGDKPAVDIVYLEDKEHMKGDIENSILYYTGKPGETELGGGIAMAYHMSDDKKGFTQEVRIPWQIIYKEPHHAIAGDKIRLGLEFHYGTPAGNGTPLHTYSDNMQSGKTTNSFFWTAVNSWGDLTLLDGSVNEPRRYRVGAEESAGTIPLRCKVPSDALTFSVTVDTPDGHRVRNVAGGFPVNRYAVSEENGETTVEVHWDGLDENGDIVSPGNYCVSGVSVGKIDGYYESSFYNPGTPPWRTSDTTGAWGADHNVPHRLAAAGDGMLICSKFAEGGYGTFLICPDGSGGFSKRWSEIRGTNAVAADSGYAYIIPNDWSASGIHLLRMRLSDGMFIPFSVNGCEKPMPYPLTDLFGCSRRELPAVLSMVCSDGKLIIRASDNTIRVVDTNTAEQMSVFHIRPDALVQADDPDEPAGAQIASDGRFVWYYSGVICYRLDTMTGDDIPAGFRRYGKVVSFARDGLGFFYIADETCAQVIKCDENGNELVRFGKTGGRERQGKYMPEGFGSITAVAVDSAGRLWVTEKGRHPRRVSVWNPDGSFLTEFVGNAGYAGQGTFIHTQDPDKAYAELNEMVYNLAAGKWRVENIMYNPDTSSGISATPGYSHFDSGNTFFSEASGEKHEYFAVLGMRRTSSFFIMIKENGRWKPVAAICTVADLQHLLGGQFDAQVVRGTYGEWAENDPADVIFWNDFDNDGFVKKDECAVIPSRVRSFGGGEPWTRLSDVMPFWSCCGPVATEDLSFLGTTRCEDGTLTACVVKPVAFRGGGIPVYLPEGIRPVTTDFTLSGAALQLPDRNLAIAFIGQGKKTFVAGFRRDSGEILWKYLSPYHEVHGSHNAPMPKPGMLIGCLKIAGIARGCGDADVFMIRGNLGEDYFLTTDGVFVGTLTRDCRVPGLGFPDDPESMKKLSFSGLSGRGEHFSGVFTKHSDGIVRCSGGLPATEAGNIIRIEGLESIHKTEPTTVLVTYEMLTETVRANARDDTRKSAAPITVLPAESAGNDSAVCVIRKDGQDTHGTLRLTYDSERLYLKWSVSGIRWVNGGKDHRLLFKTGDCLDFRCSPDGGHGQSAGNGDFRLLAAPFRGKNVVILMKEKDSGADAQYGFRYTSPVAEVRFDRVQLLHPVESHVEVSPERVVVEFSVPWELLGVTPPSTGSIMTGDAGIIGADASGNVNAFRTYHSDTRTNLVNDQPGEAMIHPDGFCDIIFG